MEFATNSIGIVSLSPEQAAEYATHNYDHNRKVRANHVEYLANEMRNGRFMPTAEVHIMYRNGEPVLVNGQHTCAAIVKYGKPVRVTLRKTIATEAGQIAMMYAFGHDTGLSRTFNDSMRAYDVAQATGLSPTDVNALAAAIRFIRCGFLASYTGGGVKDSPADLVEDVYTWASDVKILSTATSRLNKDMFKVIRRRTILSIAIITIHYQPEKAIEFWRGVTDPYGLSKPDPRITLHRDLIGSVGIRGNGYGEVNRASRACARAWNAFYSGEGLLKIQISDPSGPIMLLGTPYNGKQPKNFISSKPELTLAAIAA